MTPRKQSGKVVFIGDELSAAAYRLAGLETRVPAVDEVESALARAAEEAALVIITRRFSERVRPRMLRARGVVLVVPSAEGNDRPTDFAQEVRRRLGIAP